MAIGTRSTSQTTDTSKVITTHEDPVTGIKMRTDKFQAFSWAWVWMSLGSFLVAQSLLSLLYMRMKTIHGSILAEAVFNIITYYLGGFIVGVVSPKVRVMEPAVGAVLAMILVHSVGMWMPVSFIHFNVGKVVVMGILVFCLAWAGAVHGEKFTRQA